MIENLQNTTCIICGNQATHVTSFGYGICNDKICAQDYTEGTQSGYYTDCIEEERIHSFFQWLDNKIFD